MGNIGYSSESGKSRGRVAVSGLADMAGLAGEIKVIIRLLGCQKDGKVRYTRKMIIIEENSQQHRQEQQQELRATWTNSKAQREIIPKLKLLTKKRNYHKYYKMILANL